MFADASPAWGMVQNAISAGAALCGILIGARITAQNQKEERRRTRIREQLQDFYSPMLGMRAEIKAKSDTRLKVDTAAGSLWPEKFRGVENPDTSEKISKRDGPGYDRINDYNNKQLEEVLIPLYRKMHDRFSAHMWLAAPSTLKHYPKLSEYVEIWDRFLSKSIPGDVIERIGHSEKELLPLYEDLQHNFDRLTGELGIH